MPGQRKTRSNSWSPYSGRACNPYAQQRARHILHHLAGSGLSAYEQELLGSASSLGSFQGNPGSGERRRRASFLCFQGEPCSLAKTHEGPEATAQSGMNGTAAPSVLSELDGLSQHSFSSLSSAPSSQLSSGMPLRPSSHLSKPDHSHAKDNSMSVMGVRRAILHLNSMSIPTEDSTDSDSEASDEGRAPPRPRSRLGHRSSASLKAQPVLPFESLGSPPMGTLSPQPPPQPPPPVPLKSRTSSWRRVASARPSLNESKDGETPKPGHNSVTLFMDQHVRSPWEPIGPPSRHSSLSHVQLVAPRVRTSVPRQLSCSPGSRQAEAAAAAARLLRPEPPKEVDAEGKAACRMVRKAASQGSLSRHAFPWRKSLPSNPVEDIPSSAWHNLDLQDPAVEKRACDTAPPSPPVSISSSPKAVFRGSLLRHLSEIQPIRSGASSVQKQRSFSTCLSSRLSKDSGT
mmetsp:Transcript_1585/g.3540  ORF Transcript_1585/g.3540 Transcript_1585/m.3540 type:complete len:459 (+) Transcript_1585:140-1516(+)